MLIFKTAKVSQTAFFKSTYKDLGCVDQAIRQLNRPSSWIFCADQGKRVRRRSSCAEPDLRVSHFLKEALFVGLEIAFGLRPINNASLVKSNKDAIMLHVTTSRDR
jgi:hypothetical protein